MSNDQWTLRVVRRLGTDVFHPPLPVAPEEVVSKTVQIGLDLLFQFRFQGNPLGRIHKTLEDRVLDPLAMVLADLGNATKSASAFRGLHVHVVGDKHHHSSTYFQSMGG